MELQEETTKRLTRQTDNPRQKLSDRQMLFQLKSDAEKGMDVLERLGHQVKLYSVRWDKPNKPEGNREYKDWIVEVL